MSQEKYDFSANVLETVFTFFRYFICQPVYSFVFVRILLIKKGGKRQIFDCIYPKTQSNERQLFMLEGISEKDRAAEVAVAVRPISVAVAIRASIVAVAVGPVAKSVLPARNGFIRRNLFLDSGLFSRVSQAAGSQHHQKNGEHLFIGICKLKVPTE